MNIKIKETRISIIIGLSIILVAVYYFIAPKYPISLKLCDPNYIKCTIVAKFKDMSGCETTNYFWNLHCDKSNKENITCWKEKNDLSVATCE